ncbi:hypothetical protein Q5P01_000128 [Channa striata]|uniref:Uncharacterized protein n=1 Tax=Channa striata TaxID=64152 RepID=A0AA88IGQ0_CHASR|nr:hypothetical protein Q5P01_000128 [Channa striata]
MRLAPPHPTLRCGTRAKPVRSPDEAPRKRKAELREEAARAKCMSLARPTPRRGLRDNGPILSASLNRRAPVRWKAATSSEIGPLGILGQPPWNEQLRTSELGHLRGRGPKRHSICAAEKTLKPRSPRRAETIAGSAVASDAAAHRSGAPTEPAAVEEPQSRVFAKGRMRRAAGEIDTGWRSWGVRRGRVELCADIATDAYPYNLRGLAQARARPGLDGELADALNAAIESLGDTATRGSAPG